MSCAIGGSSVTKQTKDRIHNPVRVVERKKSLHRSQELLVRVFWKWAKLK